MSIILTAEMAEKALVEERGLRWRRVLPVDEYAPELPSNIEVAGVPSI